MLPNLTCHRCGTAPQRCTSWREGQYFPRNGCSCPINCGFTKSGDYLQLQEGGFSLFLIRDCQGGINGVHNVCRRRAYPLVQDQIGTSSIPSCRYHGWSYGLNGKLAKAPRYEDLVRFNKEKSGLFPVHIHTDKMGFLWVNLEGSQTPSVAWEDNFAGVDEQPRLKPFGFSQYQFGHQWEMTGDYNWKTLVDNYNEVGIRFGIYECQAHSTKRAYYFSKAA